MGDLTKNFSMKEFACNDGTNVPDDLIENVERLAKNLQVLRDAINCPLHVNSAYRHPSYNRKVGGASKSQHLLGKAADLQCPGMLPHRLHAKITELINGGKMEEGGLGLYQTFVHYDIRGFKARW